jgi:hypothetical protein
MKVMVTFSFPTPSGNPVVRSGKIAEIFGGLVADLKPEAVYLYPVRGERGGHFIVNMTDSSEVATIAERFWHGLSATVEMTPVMDGQDLQKGLAGLNEIIQKFG